MLTDLLIGALRPLPGSGKLRLLNTFIPHQGERACELFGCRFRVDLGDPAHRRLYAGAYETSALRALAGLLPSGGTFVDANADIGLLTALAAQRLGPTGQILAAESRPMSYLRLERMVRDNHLNNVVLHHGPLGGRDDHTTRTLDSLAHDHGLHRIDLLKIGAADLALLAGAARLLANRRVTAIVCDVSDGADPRILQQVGVLGFRHLRRHASYHVFRVV
jgi:hypothetical protein